MPRALTDASLSPLGVTCLKTLVVLVSLIAIFGLNVERSLLLIVVRGRTNRPFDDVRNRTPETRNV